MHKHIKEIKQMTALLEKGYPIEGMVRGRERSNHSWYYSNFIPDFIEDWEWEAALERVEDKYVFEGDELYCTYPDCHICKRTGTTKFIAESSSVADDWSFVSWSQPKPATVTVTLLREDAEYLAGTGIYSLRALNRVESAFKEALK
jgi:hypothetical protein